MKKTIIFGGIMLLTGMLLGDKCNILDKTINKLYYNCPVSEETYQRPFDLHKEYKINENGELEVYFGDTELYIVDENLRVNKPTFIEYITETGSDLIDKVEGKFFK